MCFFRPPEQCLLGRVMRVERRASMDKNKLNCIRKYAKQGAFWTVSFCYFFSLRLVAVIEKTRITPDMLTWSSIFLCSAGAALLFVYPGNYGWWLAAGLLFQAAYILDCADGQLARYKQQFSENGWRIDLYSDRFKEYIILLSMTYVVSLSRPWFWLVGMTALAVLGTQKYIHLQEIIRSTSFKIDQKQKLPDKTRVYQRKTRLERIKAFKERFKLGFMNIGEFYFLNLIFIIAGRMEWFFYSTILYGLFSLGYYLALSINNERFFRLNLSKFLQEDKDLVVFGTGAGGRNLVMNLLDQGINIAYLCDNNREKWGTSLLGLEIKEPERLKKEAEKTNVIIASAWWHEIYNQLLSYGLKEEQILTVYD